MNRENIKRVRDHIAGLPAERFGMSALTMGQSRSCKSYGEALNECGTAACIAGWAIALLEPHQTLHYSTAPARKLFDLTHDEAFELFMPDGYDERDFTTAEAVQVLDHLLATGEVDWSVIGQEGSAVSDGATTRHEGQASTEPLPPTSTTGG